MRYLFGFLCVCGLGVVSLVGCSETAGDGGTAGGPVDQVTCSESLPCTVWLLGDSNTEAMGGNFVPIDGNHPEYNTVNLGRGGASSADGLADVESLLATRMAPEIAVVTYAGGDLLEGYPAAPPGATSPTRAEVDQIYGNLEAICELLQSEGTYCVLGKSIGALTELHPLDEGLPPRSIDFAALTYFDNGYVLVGEAIEERYQPGWVSFRVPKDFDLWDHGDLFGYLHLTQAGYSIMSDRLEAKLDDLIIDPPKCQIDEDCDDQNECTEDRCIGGACESTPVADGTLCTEGECLAGVCAPIGAFPCTEQGIRDAISEGGGPHFFACDGTRPVVTQSEIFIGDDVILDGRGNLTVDGNEDHRVFQVSENVTAELRGFTITGGSMDGNAGGGLWNEGTLTLSNCTVSENITNGITNHRGTLTLIDSAVWGNTYADQGAGIRNQGAGELGKTTLINTTVSGNTATGPIAYAGGIANYFGELTLIDSTVSGNSADRLGGGGIGSGGGGAGGSAELMLIRSTVSGNSTRLGSGGGINNSGSSTVTLINSTVSENSAGGMGGGLYSYNEATLMLINSTVSENTAPRGDGIGNTATLTLTNTLLEDDCYSSEFGETVSGGYNIESPGDTCGFNPDGTDQVNVSADDLKLGELADNGEPTKTHALGAGSVAIDVIPPEACLDAEGALLMTDQRGLPRPAAIVGPEPMCDVGAFEVQP